MCTRHKGSKNVRGRGRPRHADLDPLTIGQLCQRAPSWRKNTCDVLAGLGIMRRSNRRRVESKANSRFHKTLEATA
jgi:hypothetical protein